MEKQKLIDQFHKNSVEIVKVQLEEFRDREYIDVRIWYLEDPAKNDSEKPTHKGLTLRVNLLPKLIQTLQKAQKVLKEAENRSESEQKRRSTQE